MIEHEPREDWVETNGTRLHYLDWPGREPTLFCMHGITGNAHYFDTLARQLGGRRRLIAADLRGRGLSDKPPPGSYGWEQHASDMAGLLRQVAVGPVVAVGHSLGGYVATLLAARDPQLVSHLVVVDSGIGLEEATVRAQLGPALKRLAMVFPSLDAYFDYWRQVPFIPWTPGFEQFLRADVEQRSDGTVATRTLPASVEEDLVYIYDPGRAEWFAEAARRVQAPAIVWWAPGGLADPQQPLMTRQNIEALVRLLPRGELVVVEGTNHYTILLQPEAVERIAGAIEAQLAAASGVPRR
jgi:pimeloyl-ACP methyl ester carboxylesterase